MWNSYSSGNSKQRGAVCGLLAAVILAFSVTGPRAEDIAYGAIEVVRDQWGIPHVFAATDAGAMYGLGYATAADRGFQMHYHLRLVQGRAAEILGEVRKVSSGGETSVAHDRRMRSFGLYRAARQVAENIDAGTRGLLNAYSQGVNDYFETHREQLHALFDRTGLSPEQWTAADCIASWWHVGQFFATDGTRDLIAYRNLAADNAASSGPLQADDLAAVIQRGDVHEAWIEQTRNYLADRGFEVAVPQVAPLLESRPRFSHAWVVGGGKSSSGSAVLLSDPQTPVTNPSLFYEFHIKGESFDARGIGVPGSPIVLIGFTPSTAWGVTALGADQADLFRLRTDADHPDHYFFDGEWRQMRRRTEAIRVKGGRDQQLVVRETHLGPVVTEFAFPQRGDPEVAMKRIPVWETGRETIQGAMAMLRARSVEEFDRALAGWRFPSINILFADRRGQIGFRTALAAPLRSHQAPNGGRAAHDGTDGRFDWQEIVPHELMPHVIGPQRDFLYSANHRPIGSFYSIPLGISTGGGGHTVRSWRLDELMAAREQFAPRDVLDIHFDSVNPALRDIVRLGYHLRDVQEAPLADETLQALEHLEEWLAQGASSDLRVAGAEVATRINTLFRAGNTDLAARYGGGQSGLVAFLRTTSQRLERDSAARLDRLEHAFVDQALSAAWTKAARELGRDPNQWQERARAAVEEAKMGYFQGLHGFPSLDSRYDVQVPALTTLDGSTIKSQRGQSYTQFVPLDNPDRALSLLPIGPSEHPTSPFRTSAMDLWARGELHPAPLSRQAVEGFSISVEVLEPLGADTAVREEQSAGRTLASGVYLYRLESGSNVAEKKMNLLR